MVLRVRQVSFVLKDHDLWLLILQHRLQSQAGVVSHWVAQCENPCSLDDEA